MIGFAFAMLEEAMPFVRKYGWEEVELNDKFTIYEGIYASQPCVAVITGIGKVNAAVGSMVLVDYGVDVIVNIGSCGANAKDLKIGDIVVPVEFYDGDFDLSAFGNYTKNPFGLPNMEEGLRLYTFSRFVTEKVSEGDYIVDMEGYAIACLCNYFDIEFLSIKIVSDNANESAVNEFDGNINMVMEDSVDRIELIVKEKLKC